MIKNMILPFYFGFGGRIGSGKQFLPWIHVEDLTRLILFAIENEEVQGILNGVAPQVITNEEFTNVCIHLIYYTYDDDALPTVFLVSSSK